MKTIWHWLKVSLWTIWDMGIRLYSKTNITLTSGHMAKSKGHARYVHLKIYYDVHKISSNNWIFMNEQPKWITFQRSHAGVPYSINELLFLVDRSTLQETSCVHGRMQTKNTVLITIKKASIHEVLQIQSHNWT